MKLLLAEIKKLDSELGALLKMELTFPLRFRIETKFLPTLTKAVESIAKEIMVLATKHGAVVVGPHWSFKTNDVGEIIDTEKHEAFQKEASEFLLNEENSIEFEHLLYLSMFANVNTRENFSVLCKLIEE